MRLSLPPDKYTNIPRYMYDVGHPYPLAPLKWPTCMAKTFTYLTHSHNWQFRLIVVPRFMEDAIVVVVVGSANCDYLTRIYKIYREVDGDVNCNGGSDSVQI